jgi:hypothetical protein
MRRTVGLVNICSFSIFAVAVLFSEFSASQTSGPLSSQVLMSKLKWRLLARISAGEWSP